jgi:transcription elongation factor Elf1
MAKTKRGKNLKKIEGWRGTCPVCGRTRVKLLWTKVTEDATEKCCKLCGK